MRTANSFAYAAPDLALWLLIPEESGSSASHKEAARDVYPFIAKKSAKDCLAGFSGQDIEIIGRNVRNIES
jgi:hypothetical protein